MAIIDHLAAGRSFRQGVATDVLPHLDDDSLARFYPIFWIP